MIHSIGIIIIISKGAHISLFTVIMFIAIVKSGRYSKFSHLRIYLKTVCHIIKTFYITVLFSKTIMLFLMEKRAF